MAKQIYRMNLKHHMGIAESSEGFFEELNTLYYEGLKKEDVDIKPVVSEEITKKMLLLHRLMYNSEQFEYNDIVDAIISLVPAENWNEREEIADGICTTGERLSDLTEEEFMDWFVTE